MKNAVKFISFVIAAIITAAVISSAPCVEVRAEDVSWKQSLKDFLVNNFPSLFDRATIEKNKEVLNNWLNSWGKDKNGYTDYSVNTYVPKPGDIPADALDAMKDGKIWDGTAPYYPMLLPMRYKFYDLDNDGIPEVVITYPTVYAEGHYDFVYKLNVSINKYEKLYSKSDSLDFYTNSQNKLVAVEYFYMSVYGVYFADIKNGGLIFGDYTDSKGSDTFNGNKYNYLGGEAEYTDANGNTTHYQAGVYWDELSEELKTLTPVPVFDCSDVVDSIQDNMPAPKTGGTDAGIFVFPAVVSAIGFSAVLKNKRNRINI